MQTPLIRMFSVFPVATTMNIAGRAMYKNNVPTFIFLHSNGIGGHGVHENSLGCMSDCSAFSVLVNGSSQLRANRSTHIPPAIRAVTA